MMHFCFLKQRTESNGQRPHLRLIFFLAIVLFLGVFQSFALAQEESISVLPSHMWTGRYFYTQMDGTHRFMLEGGAYSNCFPQWIPFPPEWVGYITKVFIFKNHPIEWEGPGGGWVNPCCLVNWDYELGSSTGYTDYWQASEASRGMSVDIPLKAGDYLVFEPSPYQACTPNFDGGVGITVQYPKSTLTCKILDSETLSPISGATLQIEGLPPGISDSEGNYFFPRIYPGDYTITISKEGYSFLSVSISIPPNSWRTEIFQLFRAKDFKINSLTSKYSGFVHYLAKTDFNVTYTAQVDWGGHPPGKVRFITPKGTYDVTTAGSTASKEFNILFDFEPCTTLRAIAISSDGTTSPEEAADFTVMSPLMEALAFQILDLGGGFYYKTKTGFNLSLLDEGIEAGVIPEDIPLFGKKGFNLRFIPTVEAIVEMDGSVEINLDWENKPIVQGEMAGFEYSLEPNLSLNGQYLHPGCKYHWSGYGGIAGSFGIKKSWPFIFMAGPIPVPLYAKASFELSADLMFGIEDINPPKLNGQFDLNPYARGSLGAGVDQLLAVEGWIGGGADLALQYPANPHLKDLTLYLNGGVSVYALLWKWEREALRWDWQLYGVQATTLSTPLNYPATPKLVSRDYLATRSPFLLSPKYTFNTTLADNKPYTTYNAPLQNSVFPYSEAQLSSAGSQAGLLWVEDNSQRSDINRTMAVHSSFNGATWSNPQPIADDGTADFHPHSLTFSDGTVVAAWEDEKTVLPDTATFDDMVQNLEISVAVLNPSTGTWTSQRMTSDGYLDRSPKVAGLSGNNVMITWIANELNDLSGSSSKPNKIYYSLYDGTAWNTPQLAAEIPYGIVKYSLAYNGNQANLVLSLDTDNDPSTINDHELYRLSYANGTWGTLTQMTTDGVVDENPQLAIDPKGNFVLTWIKDKEISSVLNFDMTNPTIIRTDEYSTNLADFKLANSPDGKLALVWAEPTNYSSDLFAIFYDPVFDVWGSPKQMTFDQETERNITAAFYGNETLLTVYNRNLVGQSQTSQSLANGKIGVLDTPFQIQTDLHMLLYTMGNDLALEAGSLASGPSNPSPGTHVTLTVKAMNLGDKALTNIPVDFYLGDPAQGGTKIGGAVINTVFKPGDSQDVSISWTIPNSTTTPQTIFAVIDPNASFDTINRTNNVVSTVLNKTDLSITMINWEQLSHTVFSITARISNVGAVASGATTVKFRKDSVSGTLLYSQNIGPLAKDQSGDVNFLWDVTGLTQPPYALTIIVDEENVVDEWDKGNNTRDVTINETDVSGPSLSITSHINGQQVTTAGITLGGTASDSGRGDNGINQVTVNGERATGDKATGSGTANWSKQVTLYSGANTITVIAYDDSPNHNSTPQSITINYVPHSAGKTDFDGDGKTDIAVWRPGDGNWYIRNSATGTVAVQQWGLGSLNDWPVPGDYDGEGKIDYGVWRPGDGMWYILRSSDGGVTATQWGSGALSDVPVPGDYDGDGKTDMAVWRPGDGNWYILRSSDGGVTATQWGSGSLHDVPVPGDYDGDGKADVAVWRPGDGMWYILRSSDGGITATQWGTGTLFAKSDVPVPGDYDGDGKTDMAVWRPGDGNWYILRSSDGVVTATQWGTGTLFAKSDVPVPGDYDGDGKTDIAVWRPGDGMWYVLRSSDGAVTATQWGTGDLDDIPIVGNGLIYRYLEGTLY